MVIKLYIDYASQPSRAVLALCLLNNISHQVVETSLMKGSNRTPEFKKINPMKLVPALYDTENDLALAECNAILRYISQKFKIDEQWYPREDLAKQAKINQYLDFHHLNTRRCSYLAFHLLFAPILKTGDPTFDEKHTYRTVRSALRNFEGIYLQDKKFIGGDKPCIADLVAFFDITMLEVLDFDYANYPKVIKWIGEMRQLDGVRKANERFEKNKDRLRELRKQHAKL